MRAYNLWEALTAAIREKLGNDPVDRRQLLTLHDSFREVLESAVSPDNAVSDMNHRAQLASTFEEVYQHIYAASHLAR